MFRRNPDVLALVLVVLVLGTMSAMVEASSYVMRGLSLEKRQHLERRVELIGQRVEEKAALIEERAAKLAERLEREAQRHAERAERLAKVWE